MNTITAPRISISEMARVCGVTFRTLRFYEAKGYLTPDREGKSRLYSPAHVDRVRMIQQGKKFGFTLPEIGEMIARDPVAPFNLGPAEIEKQIEYLEVRRAEIDAALIALWSMK